MSRARPAAVPTHRAGDLRPAPGPAAGSAPATSVDPPARPPRAQQQLQRVAERPVGDAQGRAGRPGARRGSGRCRAPAPLGAAAAPRPPRCPARACQGHTPRAGRHPAADGEIRPAGAHRVGEDGQGRGVERAVAVQHGHQIGAGVPQSGVDGSAVATPRLDHHARAPARGPPRPCRRSSRCPRRAPASRGQRREHRGQRRGLVQAGEHDLDVHRSSMGPERPADPYGSVARGGAQRVGRERARPVVEPTAGA